MLNDINQRIHFGHFCHKCDYIMDFTMACKLIFATRHILPPHIKHACIIIHPSQYPPAMLEPRANHTYHARPCKRNDSKSKWYIVRPLKAIGQAHRSIDLTHMVNHLLSFLRLYAFILWLYSSNLYFISFELRFCHKFRSLYPSTLSMWLTSISMDALPSNSIVKMVNEKLRSSSDWEIIFIFLQSLENCRSEKWR